MSPNPWSRSTTAAITERWELLVGLVADGGAS